MEDTNNNDLYGTFEVTVDDRRLSVEPNFSQNRVYYRIYEGKQFLFTLQLDDHAEWIAENEEMDPVGPPQPVDFAFAHKVGETIEKLNT